MNRTDLEQIAMTIAHNLDIDPALVCAVCAHESNWEPGAKRYEPAFYDRYISHMTGLDEEERKLRATSIGLMQVMGQVAREQGFDGPLTDLHLPAQGILQGCKKLKKCLKDSQGDVRVALRRYNGGGNQIYSDLVMKHYDGYRPTGRA